MAGSGLQLMGRPGARLSARTFRCWGHRFRESPEERVCSQSWVFWGSASRGGPVLHSPSLLLERGPVRLSCCWWRYRCYAVVPCEPGALRRLGISTSALRILCAQGPQCPRALRTWRPVHRQHGGPAVRLGTQAALGRGAVWGVWVALTNGVSSSCHSSCGWS